MNSSAAHTFKALLYSLKKGLKLGLLLALLLVFGIANAARSGGGFGGRSSGSSGSSSSRSGGGYSGGGYSRGGGYGGPIIISNGGGWGGYYGGGYSTGGFGLGLLPLLIFGGIAVFVMYSLVRGAGMRRTLGTAAGPQGRNFMADVDSEAAQALMVLVIMSEGDEVKRGLQAVAQSGDPDSDAGLAQMLQEAALVILRHPERWAYGNVQLAGGTQNQADAQLGAWATQMRAAFEEQTTSNYQNRDLNSGFVQNRNFKPQHNAGDLYLAVTVGAAVRGLNVPAAPVDAGSVRSALQTIAAVTPDNLLRAEVVWSPDMEGEFLSEDEAIGLYPQAKKL